MYIMNDEYIYIYIYIWCRTAPGDFLSFPGICIRTICRCCEATITLWSPSQPLVPSGLGPWFSEGMIEGRLWACRWVIEIRGWHWFRIRKSWETLEALPDISRFWWSWDWGPKWDGKDGPVTFSKAVRGPGTASGNGPAGRPVNPGYRYLPVPCQELGDWNPWSIGISEPWIRGYYRGIAYSTLWIL